MEAERISLSTDFADIKYNVYFKQKRIAGFDEQGCPIIKDLPLKNAGWYSSDDDLRTIKEPFAYPEPQEIKLPFNYNPYDMWTDEFADPYTYPDIENWYFPKPQDHVRYKVPGRAHLQNSYPLSQFGYHDKVIGRHRKSLPLPVNMPVPKKLPQLMYRKEEELTLEQALKNAYGIKEIPAHYDKEIVINPKERLLQDTEAEEDVPPLPKRKASAKSKSSKSRGSRPTTALSRLSSRLSVASKQSPRPVSAINGSLLTPTTEPRAKSAVSPRSILTDGSTPRPATAGRPVKPNVEFSIDEDILPHPKPPKIFLPETLETPKSALRSARDERPLTGRKSVTILENEITRPSTAVASSRPSTAMSPFTFNRPSSSAFSARETIVAPHSARPRSGIHVPLPSVAEIYRPKSSGARPVTPAEHPRPMMHSGVKITKTSEYSMFNSTPIRQDSVSPASTYERKEVGRTRFTPPPMPFFKKSKSKKKDDIPSIVTKSGKRLTLDMFDDDSDNDLGAPVFTNGPPLRTGRTNRPKSSRKVNEDKLPFISDNGRPGSRAQGDGSSSVFGNDSLFTNDFPRNSVRFPTRRSSSRMN